MNSISNRQYNKQFKVAHLDIQANIADKIKESILFEVNDLSDKPKKCNQNINLLLLY